MTELNKEELRKILIGVYENFYRGNYSKEIIQKAIKIDRLYGGAVQLLDDALGEATSFLTFAIQRQMPGRKKKQEEITEILNKLKYTKYD